MFIVAGVVGAFTDVATRGPWAGHNVWDELVERFKTTIDHSHQIMKDQPWVFRHASEVFKRFRFDNPEIIATLICMPLPRRSGVDIGKCALLPAGLPNPACPKPTAAQLDTLLLPMSHSVMFLNHSTHARSLGAGYAKVRKHQLKAGQKKNSAKKAGNTQIRTIKPGADASSEAVGILNANEIKDEFGMAGFEPVDGNTEFVEHVKHTLNYILKISPASADIIQPFTDILYALSLGADCPLHFSGGAKLVKGWETLNKLMKIEAYRRKRLQPGDSDMDFFGDASIDDACLKLNEIGGVVGTKVKAIENNTGELSDNEFVELATAMEADIALLVDFLSKTNLEQPLVCHIFAATALADAMGAMMGSRAEGKLDRPKDAFKCLVEIASHQVERTVTTPMLAALRLLKFGSEKGKSKRIDPDVLSCISKAGLDLDAMLKYRSELFFHLLTSMMKLDAPSCSSSSSAAVVQWPAFVVSAIDSFRAESRVTDILCMLTVGSAGDSCTSDPTQLPVQATTLVKIASQLADVCWNLHAKVADVDVGRHDEELKRLKEDLERHSVLDMVNKMEELGGKKVKVDLKKISLFKQEKLKAIATFLEDYATQFQNIEAARNVLADPAASVKTELKKLFGPASGAAADPTQASADTVPAASVADNSSMLVTIADWWSSIIKSENGADTGCADDAISAATMKNTLAAMNLYFTELVVQTYSDMDSTNCNIRLCFKKATNKGGKETTELTGMQRADVCSATKLALPYWGRVVDAKVASSLPRSMILPLKPLSPDSPMLYLDGSQCCNVKKSDACLAWIVKTLPKPKKVEPKSGPETAIVVAEKTSDFKRRKKELLEEERAAKLPVATHKIIWEPFVIKTAKPDGDCIAHSYARPVLVDTAIAAGQEVYDKQLYREPDDFDGCTSLQKVAKIKSVKCFSMM